MEENMERYVFTKETAEECVENVETFLLEPYGIFIGDEEEDAAPDEEPSSNIMGAPYDALLGAFESALEDGTKVVSVGCGPTGVAVGTKATQEAMRNVVETMATEQGLSFPPREYQTLITELSAPLTAFFNDVEEGKTVVKGLWATASLQEIEKAIAPPSSPWGSNFRSLNGVQVVITEKSQYYPVRADQERAILQAGGIVRSKVDGYTDILLDCHKPGAAQTTKAKDAAKRGIVVMSEDTFRRQFGI